MEEVKTVLDDMKIEYNIVMHPAALTTEDADRFIEGMEGVPSKTLFMAGKKDRQFYLIITDDKKRLNIKQLSETIGERLCFAKEKDLLEKMNLVPGIVSIFGLLHNTNHDIKVYVDKDLIKEEIITFHPNVNTATMFIKMEDMIKFFEELDYEYELIEI